MLSHGKIQPFDAKNKNSPSASKKHAAISIRFLKSAGASRKISPCRDVIRQTNAGNTCCITSTLLSERESRFLVMAFYPPIPHAPEWTCFLHFHSLSKVLICPCQLAWRICASQWVMV